jgi:hypothetical protein
VNCPAYTAGHLGKARKRIASHLPCAALVLVHRTGVFCGVFIKIFQYRRIMKDIAGLELPTSIGKNFNIIGQLPDRLLIFIFMSTSPHFYGKENTR